MAGGYGLRFFDHAVEDDDVLSCKETVKRTPNPVGASCAKFEKSLTQGEGVRHPYCRPEVHEQFEHARIICQDRCRPLLDFGSDFRIEILNVVGYKVSKFVYVSQRKV